MSSQRKNNKTLTKATATPRLRLGRNGGTQSKSGGFKRSNRLFSTSGPGNGTGSDTLRSLSGANNASFTGGIGRLLSGANSKLFRGSSFNRKSISGKVVASVTACSNFLNDRKVVNLLRPSAAEEFNLPLEVGDKAKKRSSKNKNVRKMVALRDGTLTLTPLDQNGNVETFEMHNVVNLTLESAKSTVVLEVYEERTPKDETHEIRVDKLRCVNFICATAKQAEYVAATFLHEVECYGVVIDLHLGLSERSGKEYDPKHLECMLRKRFDLFRVAKNESAKSLMFSLDKFVEFLKFTSKNETEAKYWESLTPADISATSTTTLTELRQSRAENFKDLHVNISESLGSEQDKFNYAKNEGIESSFYVDAHSRGKIGETD